MSVLTVGKLAKMLRAKVVGDENLEIDGVASLSEAGPRQISFLGVQKYWNKVLESKAGAVIVPPDYNEPVPAGRAWLVSEKPNAAFTRAVEIFAPPAVSRQPGVHPAAFVHATASVHATCYIGPCAVVDEGAEVGPGTVIDAGAYVGAFAKIGARCLLAPNCVVMHRCEVGDRVIIHSCAIIGADGFGYDAGPMGLTKIPQVGIVKLEDDVEVGASTSIDRARFGKTWIKKGVKIDDQVHVAHNVIVGEHSVLVGQCGIAGSAEIGRGVILAAQSGVNGHIVVGDKTQLAGTSSLAKSTEPGSIMLGTPAEGKREWIKRHALPKTVDRMQAKINALETAVKTLTEELRKLTADRAG